MYIHYTCAYVHIIPTLLRLSPTCTSHATLPPRQVEEGVKELVKAERHQKSGRALTCIVVLCVLIAIFLIITIVRHA